MVFELEALGREVRKVAGALLDLKHLSAGAAVEVMVVRFAGDFVAGGFTGHLDQDDAAIGDKGLKGAVDRRHPHSSNASLGQIEDFACGDRAVGLGDDGLDCVALLGVSFHPGHAVF